MLSGVLYVEVWLNQTLIFVFLALHQINQLNGMEGVGGIPGRGSNVADHIESEVLGEVRPRPVIGYYFASVIGRHLRCHFLSAPASRFSKSCSAVGSRLGRRIHFSQLSRDTLGNAAAIIGSSHSAGCP